MDHFFPQPDIDFCPKWEQVWVQGDIIEFSLYFSAGVPVDLQAELKPYTAATPNVTAAPISFGSTIAYFSITVPSSMVGLDVIIRLTYTEGGAQVVDSIPMRVLSSSSDDADKTVFITYNPSVDSEINGAEISGSVRSSIRLFGNYRVAARSNQELESAKTLAGAWQVSTSDMDDIFVLSIYDSPDWVHKLMDHATRFDIFNVLKYGYNVQLDLIADREYRRGSDKGDGLQISDGEIDMKLKTNKNRINFNC